MVVISTRDASGAVTPVWAVSAGWGAHHSRYPHAYLTAAAAIGITDTDVERFIGQLEKVLTRWRRDRPHPVAPSPSPTAGAGTNGQRPAEAAEGAASPAPPPSPSPGAGAAHSNGAPPREKKVVIVLGPREAGGHASPQPPEKAGKKSVAVTLL